MPKSSPGYQYRTTIDFGDRPLSIKTVSSDDSSPRSRYSPREDRQVDGREVIREMATEYMGIDYDLLRKNCCTFAHDACLRLGVSEDEIPGWFINLSAAGAITQDAAVSTMEPLTKVFSACDMDAAFDDYLQDGGYEVITDGKGSMETEEIVDTTTTMTADSSYLDRSTSNHATRNKVV